MKTDNLEKQLKSLPVPEPDTAARRRAVQAAVAEYDRRQTAIKGFSRAGRLTGKTRKKGGSAMGRTFAWLTLAAASLVLVTAAILPNFVSYRASSVRHPEKVAQTAPQPASPTDAVRLRRPADTSNRYTSAQAKFTVEKSQAPVVPDQTYVGRDRFQPFLANPVRRVSENPVSTFSIDVDTAAYAFVRRCLHDGALPQKNAVRIEELINYFDYDYPLPADPSVPFRPTVSVFPCPWNTDARLLHIGIKGFDREPAQTPRVNLVFLVDVSGSMRSADKLPLLKNALRMLVDALDPSDRVAIVVYAGAAGTVLESTPVGKKGKIFAVLDRLAAGGSTAGGAGIRRAYALAAENFDPDGVNRVILATDGDFNVGIRDPEALKDFVERKRDSGIYLSVLGFGQGNYNDALMQKLAQNGNGNAAYIDTLNEARKVLVDQVRATLFPIAQDVKIQVEFNPAAVAEYRLIGYETRQLRREDFNNDRVDAGEVGAGHSVTAIYEMIPAGGGGRRIEDLRYASRPKAAPGKAADGEVAFLKIRYKLPGSDTSRLIRQPIGSEHAYGSFESAPAEARFATAVAGFGQLLRGDPYTAKNFTYDRVIELARLARGADRFGYRSEFIALARLAKTARAMGDR